MTEPLLRRQHFALVPTGALPSLGNILPGITHICSNVIKSPVVFFFLQYIGISFLLSLLLLSHTVALAVTVKLS